MKRILLLCACLGLAGCSDSVSVEPSHDGLKSKAAVIGYVQDERTGLCFAVLQSMSYGLYPVASIATVDCDKVKGWLK